MRPNPYPYIKRMQWLSNVRTHRPRYWCEDDFLDQVEVGTTAPGVFTVPNAKYVDAVFLSSMSTVAELVRDQSHGRD